MDMRFLVTAIGSMSAEYVIRQLKAQGYFVVGCDIYPKEWHIESKYCDVFYQAPFATLEREYVDFLLTICKKERINCIVSLTDLEIDVIENHREEFIKSNIVVCGQSSKVLKIVRNKYLLYDYFKDDENVPSINTCLLTEISDDMKFPCIAKPYDGRSSEGVIIHASKEQILAIENKNKYIIQEQITGDVFTVDYCRNANTGTDVAVPRQELLRTKNGAGLTVKICSNNNLINLASYIGERLEINGCINMEFIHNDGKYYLIDINPRFSAGVAFSVIAGYDMVNNHLKCFCDNLGDIDNQPLLQEKIIIKKYQEVEY